MKDNRNRKETSKKRRTACIHNFPRVTVSAPRGHGNRMRRKLIRIFPDESLKPTFLPPPQRVSNFSRDVRSSHKCFQAAAAAAIAKPSVLSHAHVSNCPR